MSFDRQALAAAVAEHGMVARVVVAGVDGSTPREPGAEMLVWASGQSGTIGGGTLEFDASQRARRCVSQGSDRLDRLPLGPSLGQCCGGAVTILTEIWDEERLAAFDGDIIARPLPDQPRDRPIAVQRVIAGMRAAGKLPNPAIVAGWFIEPVSRPTRHVWIYGAGHVGRAIVAVTTPLPEVSVTWVDTAEGRFPTDLPKGVAKLVAANPADVVRYAPHHSDHLILTYSHALDLELCHQLLGHSFNSVGLIGSKTKWARFRSRLRKLGHTDAQIDRIQCPIGDPSLGKHPQAIAVGVAAGLLRSSRIMRAAKDATG